MTADQLSQYDVTWTTPSQDATGSMPIGNGDLAANVWVEPNGNLLILVAKNDAWDENSTLCKLGRVRIRCEPPLRPADGFTQRLVLESGVINIIAPTDAGQVHLQVSANPRNSAIGVSLLGHNAPLHLTASLETWRNYPYRIITQTGDMFKNLTGLDPFPTMVTPDEVLPSQGGEMAVCHHNSLPDNDPVDINLRLQGLGEFADGSQHPLKSRTFGMLVRGKGFENSSPREIRSAQPARTHQITIVGLTLHPCTVEEWHRAILKCAAEIDWNPIGNDRWWRDFGDRSYVRITSETDEQNAFRVTQAYLLQRYMNASAGRGEFPIKHNGSLFTVGRPWDPDFRRWGGPGFWFMNQRLVYWPMLADGDFDLMLPWLEMYRRTLPVQQHRTKKYFGHAGAHYPETMTFWGAEVSGHYGWTPFEQRERPEAECAYLTYYWSGAIELILILCEYVAYTGSTEIATEYLAPIAESVLQFYEEHYPRESDGTLRFEPAQALETWHWSINPMPEIAGLRYTLPKLLAMKPGLLPSSVAQRAERLLKHLPPVPRGERDGEDVLLPAARFDIKKNTENPELYCIFPYRLFGVGKPDLDIAKRTFAKRLHVEHTCWHQDVIQMALLGMTEEAKDFVSRRVLPENHSDSRFPAFWNAFHDWIPDIDHGGVLQLAVQNMLAQCDGTKIRLLPAWPADWDVDFKLHVPGPAVLEASVRAGQLQSVKIDPPERYADLLLNDQPLPLANGGATA